MMQDIRAHKADYSLLAVIAGTFMVYFLNVKNDTHKLLVATVIFSLSYFFWGVWHHGNTHTMTRHIVLEYVLVAILGIVIVSSLLL